MIIEDDPTTIDTVSLAFNFRWPEASFVSTGKGSEGADLVERESPDVVILVCLLPEVRARMERVLVIDSTAYSREHIASALAKSGFEVALTSSGSEAARLADETGPNLREDLQDLVATQILGRVAEPDIGLVVMGSHGASAQSGRPRGGIAVRVINGSSRPVVIVPLLSPPTKNQVATHGSSQHLAAQREAIVGHGRSNTV